ncbi:hypothetical protein CDAR_550061 [Caerostris darwini]|uniref:Uncharacterized protein n=1 Tax=Caerostris darwini TaxID=1538125 RepID=A0AAV4PL83_9ARAC|nr:hypothetical protein CDAR_550061 [Caerostris darwini]
MTGRGQRGKNVTGRRARWMATFGSCNDGGRGGHMILHVQNSPDPLDTVLLPLEGVHVKRVRTIERRHPPHSKVIDDRTWSEREKCHRTPSKMDGHLRIL